ncbi:MAG: hypothetical protein EAZ48_00500 [Flavobacteriia bacterium]|nr:MAG: hypothetical protein EAZ48_00500 [Flavobacteriia bacterium]
MASKSFYLVVFSFIYSMAMSQDYIVFINGYRGPKYDQELPDNKIHLKDPTGYWYKLDDSIQKRFPNAKAFYFDAHHPLRTSTHRKMSKAVGSYLFSRFCWFRKDSRWVLNKTINQSGFQERFENGRLAAGALKNELQGKGTCKVHFVCHSMGYAYMLGMIDELIGYVDFGKALILSPEGANTAGCDWSLFEEVWQYGARADEKLADPICLQDGIAPQTPVVGIDHLPATTKGGRVYIPADYPKKKLGFIKSHHLAYYDWFHWIGPTDEGYFRP